MINITSNKSKLYPQIFIQNLDKIPAELRDNAIKFMIELFKEAVILSTKDDASQNNNLINEWQDIKAEKIFVDVIKLDNSLRFYAENTHRSIRFYNFKPLYDFVLNRGILDPTQILRTMYINGVKTECDVFSINTNEFTQIFKSLQNQIYTNEFIIEFKEIANNLFGKQFTSYIELAAQEGGKLFAKMSNDELINENEEFSGIIELVLRKYPKDYHLHLIHFAESSITNIIHEEVKGEYEDNLNKLKSFATNNVNDTIHVNISDRISIYTENSNFSDEGYMDKNSNIANFVQQNGEKISNSRDYYLNNEKIESNTFKIPLSVFTKFFIENKEQIINNQINIQVTEMQETLFGVKNKNDVNNSYNKPTPK